MPEIEILDDPAGLAARAVDRFVQLAAGAIRTRGRFAAALAGGSTPGRTYARLARADLDWRRIHLYWGDERCVPPETVDSNYRMVREALLDHVRIPAGNVHRIRGELPAEEAARDYEARLWASGGQFDLVLLGLGTDGHTASLFPGSPALDEKSRLAVAVAHRAPPPPLVDRVTLTLPAINAAAAVIFLVSGADKAEILARLMEGSARPPLLPAQLVSPAGGRLCWLVDRAAAAGLSLRRAGGGRRGAG